MHDFFLEDLGKYGQNIKDDAKACLIGCQRIFEFLNLVEVINIYANFIQITDF